MAQKPGIPKGTRDFSPVEMVRRNFIFDTIQSVFKLYGYQSIETPAMENLTTLMGKYGVEGDKLLFKILNSGDFTQKVPPALFENPKPSELVLHMAKKGLRYDLTVPFARYVVQHRNEITFPFKRYQIQPVWRADRPQRGRYQEFFQCDVDVIGSNSLLNEAELIHIIDEVFSRLNISNTIKINNRKILLGIAEVIGEPDKFMAMTIAIDKLDKIGLEGVEKELHNADIPEKGIEIIKQILQFNGTPKDKTEYLKQLLSNSETGLLGISEVRDVLEFLDGTSLNSTLELDLTLARGLNYYTGAIFEVQSNDVKIGSICGGGRYDDLTGIFGLPDVSGVGISFGADRIYDVLLETENFPEATADSTQVLFINFGSEEQAYCTKLAAALRKSGINTEVYPDQSKLKKQMTYANNKNIPFVALIGENEMNNNTVTIKDMVQGEQQSFESIDSLIAKLKQS